MKLLDTNVILRWLLDDDKRKADSFSRLLHNAVSRKEQLFISDIGIAEIVWVLESHYKLTVESVGQIVRNLLSTEGLIFENRDRLYDSVALYENHNIDFIDGYLSAVSKEKQLEAILSYDRDFDKVPGVKRLEP